jgi:hypothetical protein
VQAVLEQDDAVKTAMASGRPNTAIEITTPDIGSKFTFVVYHVELSEEQVRLSGRGAREGPSMRRLAKPCSLQVNSRTHSN